MKELAIAVFQLCAVTVEPQECESWMHECVSIEMAECQDCSVDVLTEICIESYESDFWE